MRKNPATISIKNWAKDDQPRQKLLEKGRTALSDSELLAILISSGNKEESALDLCKRILASVDNNLTQLGKLSLNELMSFKGIGEAKAISIAAALELGRRRNTEDAHEKETIQSSRSVFKIMQPLIGDLTHEEFWIVFLNNANKVILKKQISKGGLTGAIVDVRIVLKNALEVGATSIILSHNHPSGTLLPSDADKRLTQKLKKAGDSIDIKVLDHLIITDKSYFSFADENLL